MAFDSDSSHLNLDSCVTSGLTGFKCDFVDGSHDTATERSSDVATGKSITIGEGIAAYTFKDDTGELCTLKPHVAYGSSIKCHPMPPQWLRI